MSVFLYSCALKISEAVDVIISVPARSVMWLQQTLRDLKQKKKLLMFDKRDVKTEKGFKSLDVSNWMVVLKVFIGLLAL